MRASFAPRLTTTPMLEAERKASPFCTGPTIVVNGRISDRPVPSRPDAALSLVVEARRTDGALGLALSHCRAASAKCRRLRNCLTRRTAGVDPERPFAVGPMNRRCASDCGLRRNPTAAPSADIRCNARPYFNGGKGWASAKPFVPSGRYGPPFPRLRPSIAGFRRESAHIRRRLPSLPKNIHYRSVPNAAMHRSRQTILVGR